MKRSNAILVFLTCALGVPVAAGILPGIEAQPVSVCAAGVLLGAFHVVLRPILRLVTTPIGCLTLGLFTFVIDVALLYACSFYVEGFVVQGIPSAVMAALFINMICVLFRK